jgi:hypothetical protein
MINLHEQTKQNIAAANAKYQVAVNKGRKLVTFEPGDMVWLHLRKDRFPTLRRSKLMPRAAGPFKVLTKINDNAYILDLPAEFGVSTSFNVADLKPYAGEDEELPSRTTSVQEGEDDEDIANDSGASTSARAQIQAPSSVGPITWARARELNYILLLKNDGFDDQGPRDDSAGESKGGAAFSAFYSSACDAVSRRNTGHLASWAPSNPVTYCSDGPALPPHASRVNDPFFDV